MGLGDIDPVEGGTDQSGSSSSDSSSNSDDHDFPEYERRKPQLVIKTDDNGEYEVVEYPHTEAVPFKKEWFSAPWERDGPPPEEWERVWFDKNQIRRHAALVEEHTQYDFYTLLEEYPEFLLDVLVTAAREAGQPESPDSLHRTCPVCDDELHVRYDEAHEVEGRYVCYNHPVQDLADAGVLD